MRPARAAQPFCARALAAGSWLPCLAVLTLAAACGGPRGRVVLLPEPDGTVGRIEVRNAAGSQVLSRAWEATEIRGPDQAPAAPAPLDAAAVRRDFGAVLEVEVPAPAHFTLYFEAGSTQLTQESAALLPGIVAAIQERRSVEASVVGHTDTAGTKEYNYRLSLERARGVGQLLEQLGIDPQVLRVDSFGEEDPLVPTADEVAEPLNRRVEVTVR